MSTPIEMIIKEEDTTADNSETGPGFYWRRQNGLQALVCRPLEQAGFANAFSTRLGGVSHFPEGDLNLAGFNEDTAENIYENRRRFLGLFSEPYKLAAVWQIHSNIVKTVRTMDDVGDSDERADAVISDLPQVLAGVKTADCVPVLIGDPATGAYAAVHAGWRGTASSIVSKAVAAMSQNFGSRPGDLIAAIGPAASGHNYEIGQDVMDAFAADHLDSAKYFTPTREAHALVDLHLANHEQLTAAGVSPSNIFTSTLCTIERNDLFFSYRVEKRKFGKTGRLLSVIGRA